MTTNAETIADALELIQLNQTAIAAGLEEVALWIEARGSLEVHENIIASLSTLDRNSDGIASAIRLLRHERT